MNGIQTFIGTLYELATDSFRRIMNSVWCVILAAIVIYLTQLCFDSMVTTAIVATACDSLVFYALLNPRRLVTAFVLGEGVEITGETEVQRPGNKFFDTYWSFAMYLLFWVNALCFFAPLAPLRDNPPLGYFLLFGGIAIIIMYPGGKKFRKITCVGIVAVMVLVLLRIGSPAWWTQQIGMDLFDPVRVTETKKAVVKALAADAAVEDRQNAARLHAITKKRNCGEKLSDADQKFLDECRQGNVHRLCKKIFSSPAVASPTAPKSAPMPQEQKHTCLTPQPVKKRIELVGGKDYLLENGEITIRKGGYIIFKVYDIPRLIPVRNQCVLAYAALQENDGKHRLEINRQREAFSAFDEKVLGDNEFSKVKFVFQGSSELRFFQEGENRFTLSSPENNTTIWGMTFTVS